MRSGMPRWMKSALAFLLCIAPLLARVASAKDDPAAERLDLGIIAVSTLEGSPAAWEILDARPPAAYREGHIPGAHSFSWEDHTRNDERGVPYRPWPPDDLARALGAMGVNARSGVVVYGDADKSWGGEGWTCWTLEWLGHEGPVRLLAGGIDTWLAAGYPIEKTEQTSTPVTYATQLRPSIDIALIDLRASGADYSLIDTRSNEEWLLGGIPGAVHIPWDEFHRGEDRRPIGADALKTLLREHDVNLERPVVYYCAGGVRSAYCWLVHELSGLPPARNYEGGMEEWKRVK